MFPARATRNRQSGAALLLLMMVLGLGVSAVLVSVFNRPSDGGRVAHTDVLLAQAREALIGYMQTHGRLPAPAISASDGRESPTACSDAASCTGVLPWVTLGIPGADSWSKLLRYSVTPGYTGASVTPYLVLADKTVLTRDAQNNISYRVGLPICDPIARCAVAVIFSSGKRNLGISVDGIAQGNSALNNIDEQQNDGSTNNFVSRALESNPNAPGGEFDDQVVWIPVGTAIDALKIAAKK